MIIEEVINLLVEENNESRPETDGEQDEQDDNETSRKGRRWKSFPSRNSDCDLIL